ncbi:coatomer epsilon subunit [Actinidia rufa]|uniref:Coatomer epsilon subunit n=1 Tax=Actinidia rufa TaxID=165716 RepID=A0A7J0G5N7_9ERIC|nr:coatomer epsilon subunit [Actinidia rufa]
MAAPDLLFGLRNNFYLGAYQAAINNSNIPNLSSRRRRSKETPSFTDPTSLSLVINEIDSSAATPLQAVKIARIVSLESRKQGMVKICRRSDFMADFHPSKEDSTLLQETMISSLHEWLADPAIGNNPILRLIAGIIFMHEQDYNEALKHTNVGGTMDLHALNVQIFLKMHRSDYAEKQLRIMQQIDEDHTLTQLANAWLNLAVDAKDPETLANLVVCSLHLGKSSSRYLKSQAT